MFSSHFVPFILAIKNVGFTLQSWVVDCGLFWPENAAYVWVYVYLCTKFEPGKKEGKTKVNPLQHETRLHHISLVLEVCRSFFKDKRRAAGGLIYQLMSA